MYAFILAIMVLSIGVLLFDNPRQTLQEYLWAWFIIVYPFVTMYITTRVLRTTLRPVYLLLPIFLTLINPITWAFVEAIGDKSKKCNLRHRTY